MHLRRVLLPLAVLTLTAGSSLVGLAPASAVTVTWVSGVGDDVNPCSRNAPCKTFAGAISKTEEGGTIIALDSGGFGAVNITKSITIDGSAVEAGALNSNTNGIIVNADATDKVILRNLDIYAGYTAKPDPADCSPNGLSGIRVLKAGTVLVQNTRIAGQSANGVLVAPTTGNPTVTIDDTAVRNGCGAAVQATPGAGASATVNVVRSTLSANDVGVGADQSATVRLTGTTVFGNGAATRTTGNGSIDSSDPSNHLLANAALAKPNAASLVGGATPDLGFRYRQ